MTCTTLAFPARCDVMAVSSLREAWLAALSGHTQRVEINCSAIETMTAAAAQLVFSLHKMLISVGGMMALTHLSPMLREDFRLLGLSDFCAKE